MSGLDVVVVGGRVAGASTALLLARAGLSVALVDRGRRGSDTLSTHALMRAGVLQLSRWGVLGDVVAAGTPADPPHGLPPRRRRGRRRGHPAARRGGRALRPRRHLLDRLLVEAAEDAGVRVLHETTVTSLRRDADGRVAGVVGRTGSGAHLDLAAGLTSAPTGSGPRVAEQVGAATTWRGRTRERGALPLRRGPRRRRLRVDVRRRRGRRRHPHQRRRVLPVRVDHPGADAPPAPLGRGARRRRAAGRGRPGRGRAGARRPAGLAGPRLGGVPGFARQSWGRGGRWSGTRATSRTRSPRTASPTRCATPSCSPGRCVAAHGGDVAEDVALARLPGDPRPLSRDLVATTERRGGVRLGRPRHPQPAAPAERRDGRRGRAPRALPSRSTPERAHQPWPRTRPRKCVEPAASPGVESHRSWLGGCGARRHQPPRRFRGRRRRPRRRRARLDPSQRRHAGQGARPPAGPAAAPRAGGRPAVARPAARAGRARGCTRRPTTRVRRSGVPSAVVLAGDVVALLPDADVVVDVERFDRVSGDPSSVEEAIDLYRGDLLPEDLYEPWADAERERLRVSYLELLRSAGRWAELVAAEPLDEEAHLRLVQQHVEAGDRRQALRQLDAMARLWREELGVEPGPGRPGPARAGAGDAAGRAGEPGPSRARRRVPRPATPTVGRDRDVDRRPVPARGPPARDPAGHRRSRQDAAGGRGGARATPRRPRSGPATSTSPRWPTPGSSPSWP